MGSALTPPRLIILEWKGSGVRVQGSAKKKQTTGPSPPTPLLLVGKAITFDTGGISIKPREGMHKMVYDKCGAMAVLGAMIAIARLKLPIHVVALLAAAENHVSDTAYRPGDILKMYNGVTVEVTNTDAEGRLVLADALAWGIETYKPAAVVDLATLTGGVVVALGHEFAGLISTNDVLSNEITDAARAAGEKVWRLPLGEEVRELMKSDHADIVNSGGRFAHPLQGGEFLRRFVPEDGSVPWVHLDIAGVADSEKDLPMYAKGATGWGVRTLVEWLKNRANSR
jgi:leucyl aminopeptidase